MDTIFSKRSMAIANGLAKQARTPESKINLAREAEDEIAGKALYLGAAIGAREAAMFLYQLAEHLAGQPSAATDTDPTVREWK